MDASKHFDPVPTSLQSNFQSSLSSQQQYFVPSAESLAASKRFAFDKLRLYDRDPTAAPHPNQLVSVTRVLRGVNSGSAPVSNGVSCRLIITSTDLFFELSSSSSKQRQQQQPLQASPLFCVARSNIMDACPFGLFCSPRSPHGVCITTKSFHKLYVSFHLMAAEGTSVRRGGGTHSSSPLDSLLVELGLAQHSSTAQMLYGQLRESTRQAEKQKNSTSTMGTEENEGGTVSDASSVMEEAALRAYFSREGSSNSNPHGEEAKYPGFRHLLHKSARRTGVELAMSMLCSQCIPFNQFYLRAMRQVITVCDDLKASKMVGSDVEGDWWALNFQREFVARQQMPAHWKVDSELNENFATCLTYPQSLVVPSSLSSATLKNVAETRSIGRMQTLTYFHKITGAGIVRCSQPLKADQFKSYLFASAGGEMMNAIRKTCSSKEIIVFDLRPYTNAVANCVTRGSYEKTSEKIEVVFSGIGNIHRMRDSFLCLSRLVLGGSTQETSYFGENNHAPQNGIYSMASPFSPSSSPSKLWAAITETKWLDHVFLILSTAIQVAREVNGNMNTGMDHAEAGHRVSHSAKTPENQEYANVDEETDGGCIWENKETEGKVSPMKAKVRGTPLGRQVYNSPMHTLSQQQSPLRPQKGLGRIFSSNTVCSPTVPRESTTPGGGSNGFPTVPSISSSVDEGALGAHTPTSPITIGPPPLRRKGTAKDNARIAVVHCSDGWDRTSQVCALAQVLLDPYFRTLEGLVVLVEKEFTAFGHQFRLRAGCELFSNPSYLVNLSVESDSVKKRAVNTADEWCPVFVQFLDCLYQLTVQYPTEFEYSTQFLTFLVDSHNSGYFGNFACDNVAELHASRSFIETLSLWQFLQVVLSGSNGGKCTILSSHEDRCSTDYGIPSSEDRSPDQTSSVASRLAVLKSRLRPTPEAKVHSGFYNSRYSPSGSVLPELLSPMAVTLWQQLWLRHSHEVQTPCQEVYEQGAVSSNVQHDVSSSPSAPRAALKQTVSPPVYEEDLEGFNTENGSFPAYPPGGDDDEDEDNMIHTRRRSSSPRHAVPSVLQAFDDEWDD